MIDSHCHLDHEPLLSDLVNVIKRSKAVGIEKLLTISTSLESFSRIKEIINKDEMIYGTIGIHPHESNKDIITSDIIVKNLNENPKIIGIGETGLDFYYEHSDPVIQKKIFIQHIKTAQSLALPLIVHTRSAEEDTYQILKNEKKKKDFKVLIHCFTGSKKFAHKLIDLGCYISASGVVTFKKSKQLADTFLSLPNDKILVETDSPYLSPEPLRGKPNEPAHIVHTVNFLAKIKNIDPVNFGEMTTSNFFDLFGKLS